MRRIAALRSGDGMVSCGGGLRVMVAKVFLFSKEGTLQCWLRIAHLGDGEAGITK